MKSFKPTSPGRRQMTVIEYRKFLTTSTPEKSLTSGFRRSNGRNSQGRITMNHKGGGVKRLFRDVDFKFDKKDIPAEIKTIEYDPNRSGFIALVQYKDGEKRYILASKSMKVGDTFVVSETAPITLGNRVPLKRVPVGTYVYNAEIKPGNGGKLGRSAGNHLEVIGQDAGFTMLKMPSTEVRRVVDTCYATIGEVSNDENWLVNIGKAGRSRWLGIRPTVRATAMNPVDHPYGGGEGRQPRGTKRPKTRTGRFTDKGQKTRTPKKYSNVFIVSRRKVGKGKDAK